MEKGLNKIVFITGKRLKKSSFSLEIILTDRVIFGKIIEPNNSSSEPKHFMLPFFFAN